MRRTDRLFEILQMLGDHALHSAAALAATHNVSLRTIYRDIARLQAAGVPVHGTRGAGYRLAPAITLPPLTLTEPEIEALQLGLAILLQTSDPDLRQTADSLAAKIDAALPAETIPDAQMWQQISNPFADPARGLAHLPTLRAAIRARQKVQLLYTGAGGMVQTHILQPERLTHHARSWILDGWSETSQSPQSFRVDLVTSAEALPELF